MARVEYELTDLFAGEANYSWVKRGYLSNPAATARGNITKVKRLLGYSGMRHTKEDFGDMVRLSFECSGLLHVLFITWTE